MKKEYVKLDDYNFGIICWLQQLVFFQTAQFRTFHIKGRRDRRRLVMQTEIEFVYAYQNASWNQAIESVIAAFEEANPDIKVNYQISYEDVVYEDVLNKRNARGELGDIIQIKTPYFYATTDVLAPISEEVSDLVFSKYEYNGQVYAVGAIGSTVG
jgi:raffinose/stachyose/melibiose transport system substrate-binding protein